MKSNLKLRHENKFTPPVCPYFDKNARNCARDGCYRKRGYECIYKYIRGRKRAKMRKGGTRHEN